MTRKDYNLIAGVIREAFLDSDSRLTVAKDMARALKGTNYRFDEARFMAACKPVKGA